jgi:hypothetical protein
MRRWIRQELGFLAGLTIGALLFIAGFLYGASFYRATTLAQGQQLDVIAARRCLYLSPSGNVP